MNSIFIGVRGLGLTLLILVAIGHADLQASVAGSGHRISGLGRLGRDLVRRECSEAASSIRGGHLEDLIRPPTSTG
jgi:hypothetical protein